jgi:hypothetical protein
MARANKVVMTVAGVVLIVATLLKCHQLLTEPIISEGFWESWEFFLIQIPLELGLGIWLVSGLFRKAGWLLAVIAFGVFIGATLHRGLIGAESCGCFGVVKVNPWITLSVVDIPLLILLLAFRPVGAKLLPPPWPSAKHFFGVAIPTFLIMAVMMPVLIFNKPAEKTDKYEVVRPEEWATRGEEITKPVTEQETTEEAAIEKPSEEKVEESGAAEEWEMLEHIDIADMLRSGVRVVFFYRHDCDKCHEAVPEYLKMSEDLAGGEEAIQVAFIEVPPYGSEEEDMVGTDTSYLKGKLDSSKTWYLTTPLIVVTIDGQVIQSWVTEAPSLDVILEAVFGASQ